MAAKVVRVFSPGILGLIMSIQWAMAETAIVWESEAPLFANARIVDALLPSQIVPIKKVDGDREWLALMYKNNKYHSLSIYFRTEADLRRKLAIDRLHLSNRLAEIDRSLHRNFERLSRLHSYIFQVEWDRMAYYQVLKGGQSRSSSGFFKDRQGTGVLVLKPDTTWTPDYVHYDKLPRRKAKKLLRNWRDELEAVSEKNSLLQDERQRLTKKLVETEVVFRQAFDRFRRYTTARATYDRNKYILVNEYAGLYQDKRKVDELHEGTIVVGKSNHRYRDRLELYMGGRTYDTSAKYYTSRDQIEIEHSIREARLQNLISKVQNEIKILNVHEKMHHHFLTDLEYASRLPRGEFIDFKHDFHNDFRTPPRLHYWIECPSGGQEVIHRSRARRTQKRWIRSAEELGRVVDDKVKQLGRLEEKLLVEQLDYDDLMGKFNARERIRNQANL